MFNNLYNSSSLILYSSQLFNNLSNVFSKTGTQILDELDIKEDDTMILYVEDNKIILEKKE